MVGLGSGLTQPVFIFRVDQFTNARGQDLNPLGPARFNPAHGMYVNRARGFRGAGSSSSVSLAIR